MLLHLKTKITTWGNSNIARLLLVYFTNQFCNSRGLGARIPTNTERTQGDLQKYNLQCNDGVMFWVAGCMHG